MSNARGQCLNERIVGVIAKSRISLSKTRNGHFLDFFYCKK